MSHSNWTWNGVHYCHYVSNFTAVGGDPNSNYPPMGFIHGTGVPPQPTFADVPASNFAYNAVETLARRGIINGGNCMSGGGLCFRPNDN